MAEENRHASSEKREAEFHAILSKADDPATLGKLALGISHLHYVRKKDDAFSAVYLKSNHPAVLCQLAQMTYCLSSKKSSAMFFDILKNTDDQAVLRALIASCTGLRKERYRGFFALVDKVRSPECFRELQRLCNFFPEVDRHAAVTAISERVAQLKAIKDIEFQTVPD